jgi:hypothetical protein
MSCQPCEARKARLVAAANEGQALPPRDWAFYAGWGLAFALGAALIWSRRTAGKGDR